MGIGHFRFIFFNVQVGPADESSHYNDNGRKVLLELPGCLLYICTVEPQYNSVKRTLSSRLLCVIFVISV